MHPPTIKLRWPELGAMWSEVALTGLWLAVAVVLSLVLALLNSPLVPLPGLITLLLVPGAGVMSMLQTRPANTGGRLALAVSLSMMVIMVVGGAASLLGPHIGLAHPLNSIPEVVIWSFLAIVLLVISAIKHCDPVGWIFEGVRTTQIFGLLAGGLLVTLSILGAAQLNYSGNNHLAVFAIILDVVVLLVGIVGGWSRTSRWPLNTILYCVSLAILLSTSLRGGHLYGWDIQEEFGVASLTLRAGVWVVPANHDPYASMLSLTVLPTVLHSLVKLRLLAFFQLVVPSILALLPLAVFSTVRAVPRWITYGRRVPRPGLAFAVVVGLIISSVAFSSDLVSITRQAMALTMLTALAMVLFDRTMSVRPAQIIICLLIVAISFTHYTTSYLLAGILLCAWAVSLLWARGWLGTSRERIEEHRYHARSRRIINVVLVVVALAAAFGWNLGVTRNYALTAPSSAITANGAGLAKSTETIFLPPRTFEKILVHELQITDSWIVPVSGSSSVRLKAVTIPSTRGVAPGLAGSWNELNFLAQESLWVVLGIALLYGLFRLGRRRSYQYSSDLVGLGVAGLLIAAVARFSGTLAAYYNPERAAIFTAILLAVPVTLLLDDLVTILSDANAFRHGHVARVLLGVGFAFVAVQIVFATGLGALFFGGEAPGSLSARDINAEEFTVSTPELATALWLRENAKAANIVQSDLYGHLVLLSELGNYDLIDEIVPPEIDQGAYIYLSTVNLENDRSQAEADGGIYLGIYRTNLKFFNRHFNVVYSTGVTRVYH
jgi:uncharacterized membrane protein